KGVPPGQLMVNQRVDGWRVVERADLEHPLELVGKTAKGVDQVAQHNDTYSQSPGCPAGVEERATEHAQASREEEEAPLDQQGEPHPRPVDSRVADNKRVNPDP